MFGGFAVVALLLAALGIYGVMSFAVAQRGHEIGVRMAVGVQRSHVVWLLLTDGIKLALIGVGIGSLGVVVLGRSMHSTLYGVRMIDGQTFAVVAVALLAIGVIASYVPARRSAKIDPIRALRQ